MRATRACNIEFGSTVFANAQNKPNMTDTLSVQRFLPPMVPR